jgi:NCAIR mutase (PurE)-related protein
MTFRPAPAGGHVVVVTAGTADLPVADRVHGRPGALGFTPTVLVDCGVAGLHRLLAEVDELAMADAVVVIAGMEGRWPASSVVSPRPRGGRAHQHRLRRRLRGVTALLAMLAACASGVTVVGIDNGYGAACAVARLLP